MSLGFEFRVQECRVKGFRVWGLGGLFIGFRVCISGHARCVRLELAAHPPYCALAQLSSLTPATQTNAHLGFRVPAPQVPPEKGLQRALSGFGTSAKKRIAATSIGVAEALAGLHTRIS